MFNCDITKQPSVGKPIVVIDQKRDKIYPNGTRGWEIVKELKLSSQGYAIWQRNQPASEGSMKDQLQKLQ